MPEPSNPALPTPPSDVAPKPRNMLRLNKAGWIIKGLASLFVFAFLCAYFKAYTRYGTPRTETRASLAHPLTQTCFTPTHSRVHPHRHVLLPVRQAKRHPQHSSLYHLASLRRLRRFFSQMLVMRS